MTNSINDTANIKPIAIIGAMAQEVAILTEQLEQATVIETAGISFYTGLLAQKPVVIVQSGIGKVNAAVATSLVIDRFSPRAVINTGSAGGINRDSDVIPLAVGDVVIGDLVAHHDVDVTAFGYKIGQMAQMPESYPCNPDLAVIIKSASVAFKDAKVHSGQIVSGDQFIASTEVFNKIRENFVGAKAVEMEAAAIAQTCYRFDVPFVVVRAISDLADEEASVSFDEFIEQAGKHSAQMVIDALAQL